MTTTRPQQITGLIQDREGLCSAGALYRHDDGSIRDVDGYPYFSDGSQHVTGWYGMEGNWDRLRADNGFTFLVKPKG